MPGSRRDVWAPESSPTVITADGATGWICYSVARIETRQTVPPSASAPICAPPAAATIPTTPDDRPDRHRRSWPGWRRKPMSVRPDIPPGGVIAARAVAMCDTRTGRLWRGNPAQGLIRERRARECVMACRGRILFVNRFYDPDHSATAQILTDLAEALAARGWEVSVVTSRLRYDDPSVVLPGRDRHAGVTIRRVWTSRFGRAGLVGRAIDYLCFLRRPRSCALLRLARRGDMIVAKTDPPLLSVIAALGGPASRRQARELAAGPVSRGRRGARHGRRCADRWHAARAGCAMVRCAAPGSTSRSASAWRERLIARRRAARRRSRSCPTGATNEAIRPVARGDRQAPRRMGSRRAGS